MFAASAADVISVIADGRAIYTLGDDVQIGSELEAAIGALHG